MSRVADPAPYMRWSKLHARAPHDLTGSNLFPVDLDELPGAREALRLSGPNDEGYAPLIEAIARRYGVSPERVCTAPGTSGANFLVLASLLGPGDDVLIERPAYDPIIGAARLLGASVRRFGRRFEDAYQPDPDEIGTLLRPDTRLIVLSNLHNPSGVLIPTDTLAGIGLRAERVGARVLVDEVYLESVFETRPPPAATLSDVFVSTNSLTKTWGLAGLRCGWVIAPPEVAASIRRTRDVVDAVGSFPSDAIAAVAFDQIERLLERSRGILGANASCLRDVIEGSDRVEWVRPAGGPVGFPRLAGVEDTDPFVQWLLGERGVGVVPGRFFEEPAHFRVAVGGEPGGVAAALGRLADGIRDWRPRG